MLVERQSWLRAGDEVGPPRRGSAHAAEELAAVADQQVEGPSIAAKWRPRSTLATLRTSTEHLGKLAEHYRRAVERG